MNIAPTTKPYLVNIDLVISVDIPIEERLDQDKVNERIRMAVRRKLQRTDIEDWMMENIGEIRPDEEVETDPEVEAYEEGRQAWIQFEANNGKRAKGNPYEIGTVENAAWNRGFNVG